MRTVGIICEYNPFHLGHKHQIDILRSMGYECIVCVMSGNYTQRGELTVFDKYTRAKAAVSCGADVVFELPFPYSSLSAEGFADAGVHILSSLGVETICFGSECADIGILECAAEAILSPDFKNIYSELQKSGIGSAAAYFEALKRITDNDCSLLSNDILGISYIASIKKMGTNMSAVAIKREGTGYNDKKLTEGMLPSASAIRAAISCSNESPDILKNFVPESATQIFNEAIYNGIAPVRVDKIGNEILSFFKLMTPQEITSRAIARSGNGSCIAEDGCGICERICHTAKVSKSFEDFIKNCYTSKYPNARINRVMLFSLLGVSDMVARDLPEYTTLLAASIGGREFLSHARKTCKFPIVTKPADAPEAGIQKKLGEAADALYTSAFPSDIGYDFFIKSQPYVQK